MKTAEQIKAEHGIEFRPSQEAFADAIKAGVLSDQPNWENFAGNYMYMHSDDMRDWFKHIDTRKYVGNLRK